MVPLSSTALALGLLIGVSTCYACDPGHGHHLYTKRIQPGSTEALAYPTRELEWSDVNFISTTDSHGWLVGHQKASYPDPNYSADFGDFLSFVTHMKEIAVEKDVDLLLIDSGDLHDGNGLSDAGVQEFGEVDAVRSNQIFKQVPYDVLAIGNHELYIYEVTKSVHEDFAPAWNGRYLSSNANITVEQDGKNVSIPVGSPANTTDSRFVKFTTRKGRKVTAFGILFDFTGASSGATVQAPSAMVNETWFLNAIEEEPDFFILAGHMPVRGSDSDFHLALDKIRSIHPNVPVFIFGGHTHIRDCTMLDSRSMSLESGRYMETVGFMSSNLPTANTTEGLNITRRYIDANRNSYAFHTKRPGQVFDTVQGVNLTAQMQAVVQYLNISSTLGTAPRDYYLDRSPYGANDSMLTFLSTDVLPNVIVDEDRSNNSKIIIINSGSQRYDVYQGPFLVNDNYIVSPFTDGFQYFVLPFRIASQILAGLNSYSSQRRSLIERDEDPFKRSQRLAWENHVRRKAELQNPAKRDLAARSALTLGYVTSDTCPGEGDDTLHSPIPYSSDTPTYISTAVPSGLADDDPVDLVFLDFFASYIVPLVNALDPTMNLTASDAKTYGPAANTTQGFRTDRMWGSYAQKYWN